MHFTELIDLASERLSAKVMEASDEFFAPKENLVRDAKPVFLEGKYTDRGKWMDGWETRRRRNEGHDWCVLQLGLPGVVRGAIVDTAFFRGNYPDSCSLEGSPDGSEWIEILPKSQIEGDSRNEFAIESDRRFTHVRLNIFPDGGVARLRIYGDVLPDWTKLGRGETDLAAIEHGGLAIAASNQLYGMPQNLLMHGRPANMGDGWETKRRRGPGHDWVVVRLGALGTIRRAEIDTSHFFGSYPESASLEGSEAGEDPWILLIPQVRLQAHTQHVFKVGEHQPIGYVRLNIFPDGGVARLRVWGVRS